MVHSNIVHFKKENNSVIRKQEITFFFFLKFNTNVVHLEKNANSILQPSMVVYLTQF